jgi:hypothetical protein
MDPPKSSSVEGGMRKMSYLNTMEYHGHQKDKVLSFASDARTWTFCEVN